MPFSLTSLPTPCFTARASSQHCQHSFTALSSTHGDVASSASTAVVPPRTKKHQTRTKSKRKLRRKSGKSASLGINPSDKPLPESDVGHHVAKQYITGPGSTLRDKASRRDRMETQNRIVTEDSSHKEQMQYLRMLDRHPALVLNADYQVSDLHVVLLVSQPCIFVVHVTRIFNPIHLDSTRHPCISLLPSQLLAHESLAPVAVVLARCSQGNLSRQGHRC